MRTVAADEAQQQPSPGEPRLAVDSRSESVQEPSDTTPNPNEVVPTVSQEVISDDIQMDTSPIHVDERPGSAQPISTPELQPGSATETNNQPANGVSDDSTTLPIGAGPIAETKGSEPLVSPSDHQENEDSGDSDISMQTSSAESSSDDESYEPQLAQISDNQGALPEDRNVYPSLPEESNVPTTNSQQDVQLVDTDPSEPSPVQTDVRPTEPGPEDVNGEVVLVSL